MKSEKTDPASIFADAFIDRFGVDAGLRLDEIAEQIGLRVVEVDADGFEGVLRRIKGRMLGTVALNRSVQDRRRRKFTLAHEIGHYLIPAHSDTAEPCRSSDIETWDSNLSTREVEANRFAATALMPASAMADVLREEPHFRCIQTINERLDTSVTASAYRYVSLSDHRIAIAWSEGSRVRWVKRSQEFYRWIKIGPLPERSYAWQIMHRDHAMDDFDRLDADVWLDSDRLLATATILEHSVKLGRYGVLSLLWIDEPVEDWHG